MRTIFRLCLAAAVAAAIGLVAVPVASANAGPRGHASITKFEKKQDKRINKAKNKANKAHERIENLKAWNFDLDAHNRRQDSDLQHVEGVVNAIVAGVPDIIGGLQALQAALENDVAPALTAINDALVDPTTGLVGLNLARPQFGVFNAAGTILGSTGLAGGSGPTTNAAKGGAAPDVDGLYVVDFGNDVSSRMYQVNVFPYVPVSIGGGGTTPNGTAANCAASASIDAVCDVVLAASGGDPQNVLVQIGDGSSSGAANGFSVTAISG